MKIRQTHDLVFRGFFGEDKKNSLPNHSGLYFVYRGTQNKDNTCTPNELLYIGQAENVNDRVNGTHEHYDDWCSYLKNNEMLYYSTCPVESYLLDEVEAAYIFHSQPPVNTQCKENYNHNPVRIKSSGRVILIDTDFNVG